MSERFDETPDPVQVAALLCSKLCHDFAAPVSALNNALEVLEDEDVAMREQALLLLKASVRKAWAKVEFSRLAFGAASFTPGEIDAAQAREAVERYMADAKQTAIWKVEAAALPKPAVRTLLNLCLCAIDAIPRGGEIVVEAENAGPGGARMKVTSEGPRSRLDDRVARALVGHDTTDTLDARLIQPFYAGLVARSAGGSAGARLDGELVIFEAEFPAIDAVAA